jgi:hypothetical protein
MKNAQVPTIDTDLKQISEEIEELRARLMRYLVEKEQDRFFALLIRQAKLARVIAQRNKEHEEVTR